MHLIRVEKNKHCYNTFCQHTKPKSAGGLAYITKQLDINQAPTMIMDPDEMDDTLLEYSHEHFAKAEGSPFMIDPLRWLLN